MVGLSSAVSALTSKLNESGLQIFSFFEHIIVQRCLLFNNLIYFFLFTVGNQDHKQTETKKLLDSLSSSVTSLQSDQQNKQHDFGKTET